MLFEKKLKWYKLFESLEAANNFVEQGNVNTITFKNKKICLANTSQGFFAINDKCPHNGASLGKGHCTAQGTVVCPVHRYHFDLKTGRSKSGLGSYVQPYPLEIRDDGMFIGFEEIEWTIFN